MHRGQLAQIMFLQIHIFFSALKKTRGFRGSLRSDFDKTIDQSNVNGFSWIFFSLIIKINSPHMSGGLKGPLSPPQELEVGGRRPPYLLIYYMWNMCMYNPSKKLSLVPSPPSFPSPRFRSVTFFTSTFTSTEVPLFFWQVGKCYIWLRPYHRGLQFGTYLGWTFRFGLQSRGQNVSKLHKCSNRICKELFKWSEIWHEHRPIYGTDSWLRKFCGPWHKNGFIGVQKVVFDRRRWFFAFLSIKEST